MKLNLAIAFLGIALIQLAPAAHRSPVLVELFTSEGCSSCPPADALLADLDRSQTVPDAETIVLSEHVDYWNHIGWNDPFSSPAYSERQRIYGERLGLSGVYTPQMVVDGSNEVLGSDGPLARSAIARAAKAPKAAVSLTVSKTQDDALRIKVETEALPESHNGPAADVYLALAENEATTRVLRGENGGRSLYHVAVVRRLSVIGKITRGQPFTKEVSINLNQLDKAGRPNRWRVIVFVQERGQGRVIGSAMRTGI